MENKKRDKISVIVTIYNRLIFARNMIKSLTNQTQKIDELIFADDGSSENLMEYIKDLLPQCKFRIKHVYQKDIGFRLARSRNNGARFSEGDFLIFLDQDVILPPDFVELIYKSRKEKNIISSRAIMSNKEQKDEIQKLIEDSYDFEKFYDVVLEGQHKELLYFIRKDLLYRILYKIKMRDRGSKMVGLIFALYKKDYLEINGFEENYEGWGYEDDDFGNRLTFSGVYGVPLKTKDPLIHMWHKEAPSKGKSLNEDYYRKMRKEYFNKQSLYCERGVKK